MVVSRCGIVGRIKAREERAQGEKGPSLDLADVWKAAGSEAFKIAAVKFGVGRYLYGDGLPDLSPDQRNVKQADPATQPTKAQSAPTSRSPEADENRKRLIEKILANPTHQTVAVFKWIATIGTTFGFDALSATNKLCQAKNINVDMNTWEQGLVNKVCDYLREKARRTKDYAGELGQSAASAQSALATRTAQEPAASISPAVRDKQTEVMDLAFDVCERSGMDPNVAGPQLLTSISGGQFSDAKDCLDINVLDVTARRLKDNLNAIISDE